MERIANRKFVYASVQQCWNTGELLDLAEYYRGMCRHLDVEVTLDGFIGSLIGMSYGTRPRHRGCKEYQPRITVSDNRNEGGQE